MNVRQNVEAVLWAIRNSSRRAGRSEQEVRLVGVTKTVRPEQMLEAAEAGIRIFGENRIQEAVGKQDALAWPDQVEWHFIGHLQRNKAGIAVTRFQMVQSLDSLHLAKVLDAACRSAGICMPVLMEVNLGKEETKGGFQPEEVEDMARNLSQFQNLALRGLMAIPPYAENPEESRPYFRQLKRLFERLKDTGYSVSELSMGMSHDFEVAVEEGATMVRVGTALFGERAVV